MTFPLHNLNRARRRKPAQRRGFYLVGLLWFLVIGLLLAAFVLNWAYFVSVQRELQARADALALAGAPALLHEEWLSAGTMPTDDIETAVAALVEDYRTLNNAGAGASVHIAADDVTITLGHLLNPAAPPGNTQFVADLPWDCVRIDVARSNATGHPIEPLLQTLAGLTGVNVYGSAVARLDNQVVGVRPTPTIPAPILPLAIDGNAWAAGGITDSNSNQIQELTLRLAITPAGAPTANGAVISFVGSLAEDQTLEIVANGLTNDDLADVDHEFGPVTADGPRMVAGLRQISSSFADELLAGLGDLAAPLDAPCRIFPLFNAANSSNSQQELIGFVAGRILEVDRDADQLQIVIEPCFLIHTTVWTDNTVSDVNPYIHKLVLVQ